MRKAQNEFQEANIDRSRLPVKDNIERQRPAHLAEHIGQRRRFIGKAPSNLQVAMGWTNSHLHLFMIHGTKYSAPEEERDLDSGDERKVKLTDLLGPKDRFIYEYDFGDGWLHEIVVEKIVPREEGTRYPVCLAGARACPPEDCGGIWGYGNFLEAIGDPEHEEHENLLEWIGGSFDPEEFNLEDTNTALKRLR